MLSWHLLISLLSSCYPVATDELLSDNPANLHLDWAELAVLFSRQILSDPQDIFLSFIFMSTLLFSFIFVNVKPLKPITPAFFPTSVARLA